MAENSAIEWTDHTFNPWIGCTKVSAGCDHCYAETLMDTRYGRVQWGPRGDRVRTGPATWRMPLGWQRGAERFMAEHGHRQRVFCASLADVFDNRAPEGARDDLWALIRATPDLDWLLLTKRPQMIERMLPEFWDEIRHHVALGTSTENQDEANRRLFPLLSVAPRPSVFFVSAEPLLGPIDFRNVIPPDRDEYDVLNGFDFDQGGARERLDWVIVGGESGAKARPLHPDWIRSIRNQCAATNVAFFFKQYGQWAPRRPAEVRDLFNARKSVIVRPDGGITSGLMAYGPDAWVVDKVGKTAAGRLLDGTTHDGFPEVRP